MNSNENFGVKYLPERTPLKSLINHCTNYYLNRSLRHYTRIGFWPHIYKPRTFNEHLLHRMLVEKTSFNQYIDKAKARDLVKSVLGEQYIPKRYLLTHEARIPWDELPNRFVLSGTHGSGMTMVIGDKESLDKELAEKVSASWLKINYGKRVKESLYSTLEPGLLFEENLTEIGGEPPEEYKFSCFGGEVYCIQVDQSRYTGHRRVYYDTNWEKMPFNYKFSVESAKEESCPKPKNFETMKELAKKLSQGFDFVRVDLYDVPGKGVIFGEWTFAPGGASEKGSPMDIDWEMGKLFKEAKKTRLEKGIKEEGWTLL